MFLATGVLWSGDGMLPKDEQRTGWRRRSDKKWVASALGFNIGVGHRLLLLLSLIIVIVLNFLLLFYCAWEVSHPSCLWKMELLTATATTTETVFRENRKLIRAVFLLLGEIDCSPLNGFFFSIATHIDSFYACEFLSSITLIFPFGYDNMIYWKALWKFQGFQFNMDEPKGEID